ncbi:Putative DOMON domain, cytochrome b561/ferric reductase transmembrane [Septoria linicola]|uniref:DOMON domain, cytochrome b561/ferric reductase transmembrane n=1 Tax=Septoria linicola TaxID=215465 RepID=A0A9Q9EDZ6_9PEZI|nr:Putative DOMON domain, cytochrome b561/ferric reductase transmembrane [Septoria linicola]
MRTYIAPAAVLGLGSAVAAQSIARTCPEDNVCYSLNIPESTVQANGDGDIFFQMSAPTSYQWVALGQGSRMAGSNIFVMYTSADGQNVTVSPRLGTGHVEPQHDTTAEIEVLEGSGVADGMMTANVKCSNCNSWQGGTMDFTAQTAQWIYASRTGAALDSDDPAEDIQQHQAYSPFRWQISTAQGGDSTNPFVVAAAAPTGSDSQTASATASSGASASAASTGSSDTGSSSGSAAGSSGNENNGDTSSSGSATFSNAGAPFGGNSDYGDTLTTAHGTLASLAFVAFFPTGAILIRVASFTGIVWLHAAIQALGNVLFIAAFGLGIYIATQLSELGSYHPIIGIVLFVLTLSQPITGLLHHRLYKSRGGRTVSSFVHLGVGRAAIILGLINGGLGLLLAGASNGEKIAYAVFAALMGIIYIAAAIFGEVKRGKKTTGLATQFSESKGHRHLDSTDDHNGGIGMDQLSKERS